MARQLDFYKDITCANWKKKYGEVFDPDSGEILAHVVLTPSDFTRRCLKVKLTKWFGQYAKGRHVDFILSRIDYRSIGLYPGDSSWFRLTRTQATPKKLSAKPKPKKTATLTATQRKHLAATGRITVKRNGKFITITK